MDLESKGDQEDLNLWEFVYDLLDRQLKEWMKMVWDGFGGIQRNIISSWQSVKTLLKITLNLIYRLS